MKKRQTKFYTLLEKGFCLMKKVASYLGKTANTDVEKYIQKLESAVQQIFPKSFVQGFLTTGLGTSITLRFALGNKSEWINGIIHNDPMYAMLDISAPAYTKFQTDGSLPDKLEVEISRGFLSVTAEPGSFKAFDRVKLGWRNKAGDPDTIMKHIVSYFKKAKEIVKENKDRIPKNLVDNV